MATLSKAGIRFNSTLVRLKLASPARGKANDDDGFQFHAGSIKANHHMRHVAVFVEFQFHAGSIKADPHRDGEPDSGWFQFHAGSIKAVSDIALLLNSGSVSIPRWFD